LLARPELEDPRVLALVRSTRPDVLLSWFWPRKIPAELLEAAPRGAFGVHPSLLPRWRGPDPYFWAIDNGDATTGVTLHRLAPEYDTGNVIAQRELAISADDSAWSLARKLDRPSLALLVDALRRLTRGETLEGAPQDETLCTLAPQPGPEHLALDWRAPVAALLRRIRALAPYPGAAASLGDTPVEVLGARSYPSQLPRALEPGDAVLADDGVVIRAADGGLLLACVRDDEGRLHRGAEVASLFSAPLFRLPPRRP
jgi:methionyl-tRNA formyltransferase